MCSTFARQWFVGYSDILNFGKTMVWLVGYSDVLNFGKTMVGGL